MAFIDIDISSSSHSRSSTQNQSEMSMSTRSKLNIDVSRNYSVDEFFSDRKHNLSIDELTAVYKLSKEEKEQILITNALKNVLSNDNTGMIIHGDKNKSKRPIKNSQDDVSMETSGSSHENSLKYFI